LAFVMMGVVAMAAASLTIGVASWHILRSRALPAWLGWSGVVVALVTLGLVAGLQGPWASPLLQLWVVGASFALWRSGRAVAAVDASPGVAPTPAATLR
jgi:hypothetical protein